MCALMPALASKPRARCSTPPNSASSIRRPERTRISASRPPKIFAAHCSVSGGPDKIGSMDRDVGEHEREVHERRRAEIVGTVPGSYSPLVHLLVPSGFGLAVCVVAGFF